MLKKESRSLRVGVLGCGPIAQAAHFESCTKARNAELYRDLRRGRRPARAHGRDAQPERTYRRLRRDARRSRRRRGDRRHLRRLPCAAAEQGARGRQARAVREADSASRSRRSRRCGVSSATSGKVLQVGHMKRFDAGLQAAKAFIDGEMGELLALKAWYCDSTHRYAMTDAVQPLIVTSAAARKPPEDPKADLRRYYMLAHGSHLVDTARYFGGEIVEVEARLRERFGAYCWFVDVAFANGALGHLDLTVAVRMDWHEGFQIYGENGSVLGKTYNPWYYKTSDVEIFHEEDATTRRVLGADGHFYRRQLEGFADVVLDGAPMRGAESRTASPRCAPWSRSRSRCATGKPVRLADVRGGLMQLGIFAKTFAGTDAQTVLAAVADAGYDDRAVQHGLPRAAIDAGRDSDGALQTASRAAAAADRRFDRRRLRHLQHDPPRPDGARRGTAPAGDLIAAAPGHGHPARDAVHRHARPATTSGAAIRTTRRPRPGAICSPEMDAAIGIAERHDVDLGIEPELANVVDSRRRGAPPARRDGAAPRFASCSIRPICSRPRRRPSGTTGGGGVDLLGDRIAMAHAKDRDPQGGFVAAGQGVIDFDHFLGRLQAAEFDGPLVTHGLSPAEAPGVASFLADTLARVDSI